VKPAAIQAAHLAIKGYYDALAAYAVHRALHEGATETALSRLLADTARSVGWTLIPKQALKAGGRTTFPDGTLRDAYNLPRGYWEAKDTADDLDVEIRKKVEKKYPLQYCDAEDEVSPEQFAGRLRLLSALCETAGTVELCYDDGMLFGGHGSSSPSGRMGG
jgi:hypothetical protein